MTNFTLDARRRCPRCKAPWDYIQTVPVLCVECHNAAIAEARQPIAHVSAEVADVFGMRGLPNVRIKD